MCKMKYMKALVAMMLIAVMLYGGALAASYSAVVTASSAKVYNSVDDSIKVIGHQRRGAAITVLGISEGVAQFSYNGRQGFIELADISKGSVSNAAVATKSGKRIKAITTRSSSIKFITKKSYKKGIYYTATLAAGVTVYVIGTKGNYYMALNPSGSALALIPKSALRKVG